MGDEDAMFVAQPQILPRKINWIKKDKWVHTAKVAFDKYFMRRMKKGKAELLYEKLLLNPNLK